MPEYKVKLLVLKKIFLSFVLGMITMAGFCAGLVLGFHEQTAAGFVVVAFSLAIGTAATMSIFPFLEGLFAPAPVMAKNPTQKH